jgi:predicted RNA-binding protein with RPS1 domain
VKVILVREDGKISLSMKECDQETGIDLNPERTQNLQDNKQRIPKQAD